jgi:hypothetical protein
LRDIPEQIRIDLHKANSTSCSPFFLLLKSQISADFDKPRLQQGTQTTGDDYCFAAATL